MDRDKLLKLGVCPTCKRKIKLAWNKGLKGFGKGEKLAEKNGMWKGDKAKLGAIHDWIKRRLEKPNRCENCRKIKKLDLTNKSGNYLRNLTDWKWLCRRCHMLSDGRMKNLKNNHGIEFIKKWSDQ